MFRATLFDFGDERMHPCCHEFFFKESNGVPYSARKVRSFSCLFYEESLDISMKDYKMIIDKVNDYGIMRFEILGEEVIEGSELTVLAITTDKPLPKISHRLGLLLWKVVRIPIHFLGVGVTQQFVSLIKDFNVDPVAAMVACDLFSYYKDSYLSLDRFYNDQSLPYIIKMKSFKQYVESSSNGDSIDENLGTPVPAKFNLIEYNKARVLFTNNKLDKFLELVKEIGMYEE